MNIHADPTLLNIQVVEWIKLTHLVRFLNMKSKPELRLQQALR